MIKKGGLRAKFLVAILAFALMLVISVDNLYANDSGTNDAFETSSQVSGASITSQITSQSETTPNNSVNKSTNFISDIKDIVLNPSNELLISAPLEQDGIYSNNDNADTRQEVSNKIDEDAQNSLEQFTNIDVVNPDYMFYINKIIKKPFYAVNDSESKSLEVNTGISLRREEIDKEDRRTFSKYVKNLYASELFNEGVNYYELQDYEGALTYFSEAYQNGSPDALYFIATMVEKGLGIEQDSITAMKFYLKSSNNGNVLSSFKLGLLHQRGTKYIEKDLNKAVKFYSLAAMRGMVAAYYNVALLFMDGKNSDIKDNYDIALKILIRAGKESNKNKICYRCDDRFILNTDYDYMKVHAKTAEIYYLGKIGLVNFKKAFKHYKLAAENEDYPSMYNMHIMYGYGIGTEKDIKMSKYWLDKYKATTSKQRLDKERKANDKRLADYHSLLGDKKRKYFLKLHKVKGTQDKAQNKTSLVSKDSTTMSGNVVIADDTEINKYKIGKDKYLDRYYNTAMIYSSGRGGAEDKVKAHEIFRELALRGHVKSMHNVALSFYYGNGTERNYIKAAQWFNKATAAGYGPSIYNLGLMYMHGIGVKRNYVSAVTLFSKGAKLGEENSILKLGEIYYYGTAGTVRDPFLARKMYQKAAKQGSVLAIFNLGKIYYLGDSVQPDKEKGMEYLEYAVSRGNKDAKAFIDEMKQKERAQLLVPY